MTREEERLLLIDLSARLFYGVIVYSKGEPHIQELVGYIPDIIHYNIKPYLRPMSSMTEEEKAFVYNGNIEFWVREDYCNKHHLDYRGLIEKGLALEAPEGMYKIK